MHLQRYYSNLFVSVLFEANYCRLFAKAVKNRQVKKTFETVFDNEDDEKLDKKIITYIKDMSIDYHNIYISFYLDSIGQGAFKGVDFEKNSVDKNSVTPLFLDGKWTTYASYIDINWAKDMFEPLGLDLLYSPFVFIYHEVNKREINENITLYIYNHEDSFAMGVFDKTQLLYGSFFRTKQKALQIGDIDEDGYKEIDQDSFVDFEELEDTQEEYESLEDLDDTLDFELEELPIVDMEDEEVKEEEPDSQTSIEYLGRDMTMFKYLMESIKEFYENKMYEKKFIDQVVIFDNHDISSTLVNMIKDELLTNVEVCKVDTLKAMCDLSIEDINL